MALAPKEGRRPLSALSAPLSRWVPPQEKRREPARVSSASAEASASATSDSERECECEREVSREGHARSASPVSSPNWTREQVRPPNLVHDDCAGRAAATGFGAACGSRAPRRETERTMVSPTWRAMAMGVQEGVVRWWWLLSAPRPIPGRCDSALGACWRCRRKRQPYQSAAIAATTPPQIPPSSGPSGNDDADGGGATGGGEGASEGGGGGGMVGGGAVTNAVTMVGRLADCTVTPRAALAAVASPFRPCIWLLTAAATPSLRVATRASTRTEAAVTVSTICAGDTPSTPASRSWNALPSKPATLPATTKVWRMVCSNTWPGAPGGGGAAGSPEPESPDPASPEPLAPEMVSPEPVPSSTIGWDGGGDGGGGDGGGDGGGGDGGGDGGGGDGGGDGGGGDGGGGDGGGDGGGGDGGGGDGGGGEGGGGDGGGGEGGGSLGLDAAPEPSSPLEESSKLPEPKLPSAPEPNSPDPEPDSPEPTTAEPNSPELASLERSRPARRRRAASDCSQASVYAPTTRNVPSTRRSAATSRT